MAKFEELYNKYLQILEIEDEDEQDDELTVLDQELYEFISIKYPEIDNYLGFIDNFYEYLVKDERKYIKDLINYCMDDQSIVFEFIEHPSIDKIIEKYIDKNINNYENN